MQPGARFVAWQPVLTDHVAFTLQALALRSGHPVIAYVDRLEDSVRQAQGWTDTQVTSIERRLLPTRDRVRHCLERLREHRHDVHLFGSPFARIDMLAALVLAALLRLEFYLISEPYSPRADGYFDDAPSITRRIKAALRPLAYRLYTIPLRRHVSGVFAISALAAVQYRRCGVPASKIFPFGYFVPQLAAAQRLQARAESPGAQLRLVFVGNLIRTKGLDLLITAVRRLREQGHAVTLDVFGSGNTSAYNFDDLHVRYCGLIRFGQAQVVIAGYDLLALPSRYDGWGVVVNEALCAGVPVLCSDHVGARTVIETFGAGAVFASEDAGAIAGAIDRLLSQPQQLLAWRDAARRAASAIQPEAAAAYMLDVIETTPTARPTIPSPWYRRSGGTHE